VTRASFIPDDFDPAADLFGALSICRINDHPRIDEDANDIAFVKADADCYTALEADIDVIKYDSEKAFEVKATATLADVDDIGDEDPDDVGEVEIKLSASHCPALQDALDEAEDIAEDAAAP